MVLESIVITGIIMGGIFSIVVMLCFSFLVSTGKVRLSEIRLRRLSPGVSPETWEEQQRTLRAQEKVKQAKAEGQQRFYETASNRVVDAQMGKADHNVPPVDGDLLGHLFNDQPHIKQGAIESAEKKAKNPSNPTW